MLESDVRDLFDRQASGDQPPSRISIPAARQIGRARARRRHAGVIGAPVFAVAAVLVIALTGSVLTGTAHRPSASGTPAAAPRSFSLLRPYAWIGWLPRADAANFWVVLSLAGQFTSFGPPRDGESSSGTLVVTRAGACHARMEALQCTGQGLWGKASSGPLGLPAGEVAGRPAYWQQLNGLSSPLGRLQWQYARGGWAILLASDLRTGLRIARNIDFGPTAAPPVRFAYQLTGVPASWRAEQGGSAQRLHGVLEASGYSFGAGSASTGVMLDVTPNTDHATNRVCRYSASQVIDGHQVAISYKNGVPVALCTTQFDGLIVEIDSYGGPSINVINLFAHHLRLLGPDPAKWTTTPIAG